jgi:hypothetical protein
MVELLVEKNQKIGFGSPPFCPKYTDAKKVRTAFAALSLLPGKRHEPCCSYRRNSPGPACPTIYIGPLQNTNSLPERTVAVRGECDTYIQ